MNIWLYSWRFLLIRLGYQQIEDVVSTWVTSALEWLISVSKRISKYTRANACTWFWRIRQRKSPSVHWKTAIKSQSINRTRTKERERSVFFVSIYVFLFLSGINDKFCSQWLVVRPERFPLNCRWIDTSCVTCVLFTRSCEIGNEFLTRTTE